MGTRAGILGAAVLLLCSVAPHSQRINAPGMMLWAWERPEDLSFIDPATTGVAYLAAAAQIDGDGSVRFRFREQPLATPPGTVRIAVVRIESARRYVFPPPVRVVDGLASAAQQRGISALQIDFDARASERGFYSAVLKQLRERIALPIGITALASWCDGDPWIDPRVVSEAVPMFFRMGRNESKSMPVHAPVCRGSMGVSMGESWPAQRGGRLYVFNPHSWTRADYEEVLKRR